MDQQKHQPPSQIQTVPSSLTSRGSDENVSVVDIYKRIPNTATPATKEDVLLCLNKVVALKGLSHVVTTETKTAIIAELVRMGFTRDRLLLAYSYVLSSKTFNLSITDFIGDATDAYATAVHAEAQRRIGLLINQYHQSPTDDEAKRLRINELVRARAEYESRVHEIVLQARKDLFDAIKINDAEIERVSTAHMRRIQKMSRDRDESPVSIGSVLNSMKKE